MLSLSLISESGTQRSPCILLFSSSILHKIEVVHVVIEEKDIDRMKVVGRSTLYPTIIIAPYAYRRTKSKEISFERPQSNDVRFFCMLHTVSLKDGLSVLLSYYSLPVRSMLAGRLTPKLVRSKLRG